MEEESGFLYVQKRSDGVYSNLLVVVSDNVGLLLLPLVGHGRRNIWTRIAVRDIEGVCQDIGG